MRKTKSIAIIVIKLIIVEKSLTKHLVMAVKQTSIRFMSFAQNKRRAKNHKFRKCLDLAHVVLDITFH
jgi:hypothetical protein